jgi:hypothetical protein
VALTVLLLAAAAAGCGGGGKAASSSSSSTSSSSTRKSSSSDQQTDTETDSSDVATDASDTGGSEIVLNEDFKTDENGWGPTSNDLFTSTLGGGEFTWDVHKSGAIDYFPDSLKSRFSDGSLSNVLIDATVTLDDANAVAAVGCRSTAGQTPDGYLFTIDAKKTAHILAIDSSGKVDDLNAGSFPFSTNVEVGQPAEIEAECQDTDDGRTKLTFTLDGELLGSITPSPSTPNLTGGGVILASNSADGTNGYSLTWTHDRVIANPS